MKFKISDIGEVVTGSTPSKKDKNSYGFYIKFLTPKDMQGKKVINNTERFLSVEGAERLKNRICKPPSVSVSCIGSDMGKVCYNEEKIVSNQQINTITKIDLDKFNPHYIYYKLSTMKEYFHSIAGGSTMPIINKGSFEQIEISIPDIGTQNKVSSILSLLDNKIELNNSIISNLEELAQTLFKHWFVDFEFPNEEGKPYKSSGGKMVESELGMIPEGWEVKELNDIVQHSKKSFNPKREKQVEVAHFSLPAYDSQQYPIIEDSKTIKSNKYYIDDNSVMFSRMNPKTPRTWLPNIQNEYINVCSSEYVVLDTSVNKNKGFIFSLITSEDFNNYLINNATGSTNSRQRVRPKVTLKYSFTYNEHSAKEFERKVDAIYKKIVNLREEIFTLSNLRDTLLPKLLSGEIELPDDMEVMEDVPVP